ncbi:MAG TPA: GAP family protein, partial [Actinomycetospora sp.]|nr:GAP family protein [Actinomycetospora sp.]
PRGAVAASSGSPPRRAPRRSQEQATGRLVVDVALGVVALVWAVLRATGRTPRWRPGRRRDRAPRSSVLPEALATRLRAPTPPAVAGAGVVTNLPGLYYLAALVAILQTHPGPVGGVAQVLVYNLLRFAVPVALLVLVVLRPDRTLEIVGAVHAWGRRNATVLLVAVVGGVGAYLVVKGAGGLLG